MDISFVLPRFYVHPIGGYKVVYEYANLLAEKGHRVSILFPRPAHFSEHRNRLVGRVKLRLWSLKIRLRNRRLVSWFALHRNVRLVVVPDFKAASIPAGDAIFATAWFTAGPVLALPASKGKKFYLIQSHETWSGPRDEVDATWRMPLHIIVISKWLLNLGREIGAKQLHYIPNAIHLTQFRTETPVKTRPQHIVAMYHENPSKGCKDALTALGDFHALYPDVPVTMFGVGARSPKIPGWITYHCNPSQDALVRIYNSGTVFLAASLIEGWALPPAEAIACGCVFVGTDIGGVSDYAVHADTALLSPPGNPEGLLANLIKVTTESGLAERLRERGAAKIAGFSWEASGKTMEALIRSVVEAPDKPHSRHSPESVRHQDLVESE